MTDPLLMLPPALDNWFRPGNWARLRLIWPDGVLSGRTFTSTLDGQDLDVEVDGNDVLIVADPSITGDYQDPADWVLEEIGGEVIAVGQWYPTLSGVVQEDKALTVVLGPESSIVRVVAVAGPPGPTGSPGGASASGTINVANMVWVMTHGLGYPDPSYINENLWWFEDENGNPMEPTTITYVNPNIASAEWLDAQKGTWRVN